MKVPLVLGIENPDGAPLAARPITLLQRTLDTLVDFLERLSSTLVVAREITRHVEIERLFVQRPLCLRTAVADRGRRAEGNTEEPLDGLPVLAKFPHLST